jgi:hypothetical protein
MDVATIEKVLSFSEIMPRPNQSKIADQLGFDPNRRRLHPNPLHERRIVPGRDLSKTQFQVLANVKTHDTPQATRCDGGG